MASRKLTFSVNKMTPGTMRLQEDAPQGEEVIGPLYVKNWAWQEDQTEGGEVIGYEVVLTPVHSAKTTGTTRATPARSRKAAPRAAATKKAPAKVAAAAKKAPAGRPAAK